MKRYILYAFIALLGCLFFSCITPYEPSNLPDRENILVVEGNISLTGAFSINLSRTVSINDVVKGRYTVKHEKNARVYVEDDKGNRYDPWNATTAIQSGEFQFDLSSQNPNPQNTYRLVIETSDNNTYASDFLSTTYSNPPQVRFEEDTLGKMVNVLLSTGDPSGQSQYYFWSYTETWDYVSQLAATCLFDGKAVVPYGKARELKYMNRCWNSHVSSDILLANTENLTEDRITDFKILSIPYANQRITQHYCITVNQTVLSREAFLFFQNMKKNSGDIGGLFSPQPNEMSGNIQCLTNSETKVVGYVSVGSTQSVKAFLDCRHLPTYYPLLEQDTVLSIRTSPADLEVVYNMGYLPYLIDNEMGVTNWNQKRCIDCRLEGGEPTVPSFWPAEWPIN